MVVAAALEPFVVIGLVAGALFCDAGPGVDLFEVVLTDVVGVCPDTFGIGDRAECGEGVAGFVV